MRSDVTRPVRPEWTRPYSRSRPVVIAALAVLLMVVMAGCTAAGAGLSLTAPPPYTDTGAALNGTELRTAHASGLEEAGSFRTDTSLVLGGTDHAFRINRTGAVDLEANRSSRRSQLDSAAVAGDGLVVTRYTAGDETYRQFELAVGQQTITRYDAASEPYGDGLLAVRPVEATAVANNRLVERLADDVEWTQRGVERYDGGWVTRYEATGPENFSTIGSMALDQARIESTDRTDVPDELGVEVTSINATLLVNPAGIVRQFDVHVVGTTGDRSVELTLRGTTDDLGSTSVDEPSWIDEVDP